LRSQCSAASAAAAALGIDDGEPVIDVLRLRTLDDEPAMLERSTFVERVGRLLFDFDPDTGSIYAWLTSQGVDLHAARHTIDAVAADEDDAELLDLEIGSPLLRERRRATSAAGVSLEYRDDRYRSDRVKRRALATVPNARKWTFAQRDRRPQWWEQIDRDHEGLQFIKDIVRGDGRVCSSSGECDSGALVPN
jgi:hypothetical protein